MAIVTDYTTGTITVAAGGTTVTGTGTAWKSADIRAGDTIIAKGLTVVVTEDPTSETSLKIEPWPGTALTNAAYRIRFQPDASRLTATARDLLIALANGNLAAIADLASAADTVPYFTGAGAAALTDLTAFGRSAIGAENVDAILPGRLGPIAKTVADWNAALDNGWYMGIDAANAPGPGWWIGNVIAHGVAGYRSQTVCQFTRVTSADTLTRRRDQKGGNWGAWYTIRLSEPEQQALWDARYLGIDAKAADSAHADTADSSANADKLGGQLPAYYWSDGNTAGSGGARYQKLPSGLIMQFSTVVAAPLNANGDATFSLPIAYPTRHIITILGAGSTPGAAANLIQGGSIPYSLSSFTVNVRPNPGQINIRFQYVSFGY